MDAEFSVLFDNGTFEWSRLPDGATALGHTLQFKLKTGSDGLFQRYKVFLCARGDHQVWFKRYLDTYAPVASLVTVRVFLTFVAKLRMRARQGDVPAAYVKADLQEEIYMKLVAVYASITEKGRGRRLRKALYGLRQSGRE